jgi:hypothetical protein
MLDSIDREMMFAILRHYGIPEEKKNGAMSNYSTNASKRKWQIQKS